MKQPPSKRRRVSSSIHTTFSSSEAFVTSLNHSRIPTCTSCHRIVGLMSSPAFLCASCEASTCVICLRTCTGDPWWAGSLNLALDSTTIPPSINDANTSSPRRRRPHDEDSDNILKTKDVGCGQMVCRKCCFEHPQSGSIACFDCSAKRSNASTHGARNPDYSLMATCYCN